MSDDLLDRNLAALLTRALPDDAPSESFRRRVALTVAARLAATDHMSATDPTRNLRPRPRLIRRSGVSVTRLAQGLVGALAAAALLLGLFQGAFFGSDPGSPSAGPAGGPTGGPWLAMGVDLGARGAPLAPGALVDTLAAALVRATEPAGLAWSALPAGAMAFGLQLGAETAWAVARVSEVERGHYRSAAAQRVPLGAGVAPTSTSDAEVAVPAAPAVAAIAHLDPSAPALWVQVLDAERRAPVARFRAWVKREVFVPEVVSPTPSEHETLAGLVGLPVSPRGTQTLVIEAAGFAPWRAAGLRVNTPETPLVVTLQHGVPLVGSVLDASTSAPVAGALVFVETSLAHDVVDVHAVDLAPLPLHAATTDAAGAFRIEHAPRGELVLRASHPDFAPQWSVALDLSGVTGEAPRAVVVPAIALDQGGTVVGRVERLDGSPFENAEVILSTLTDRALASAADERGTAPARVMTYGAATTDGDGEYRITHLPAGQFVALNMGDVVAGASTPRMRRALVTEGATVRVDFVLDSGRSVDATDVPTEGRPASSSLSLIGQLREADLAPCAEVDLSLYEVHSGKWRAARTDAAGRFVFHDVPSGLWAICRATRGFADQQVLRHVDVAAGSRGSLELDLTLPRGALTFVVQHDDGRLVTSGKVALRREVAPGRFEFHAVLALHESGHTRVAGLPDGRYRATLIGETLGLGHLQVGPLELRGEVEVIERCTLPRGGALAVSVIDGAEGGPAPAYVIAEDSAGEELLLGLDSRTDGSGVRRIPCLAPGTYTLEVRSIDGRRSSVSGEVHEGRTTELSVELPPR